MTHASKRKGNSYERELVNQATAAGLIAERAYASNGKALGHAESVDLTVSGCRVQAKRRKAIAAFLQPTADHDAVVFRQDRGESLVMMKWTDFLELLERAGGW